MNRGTAEGSADKVRINFSYNYFLTGIGPSWSMSVEELFYLMCPVLFLYGKNISSLIKIILLFYGLGIFIRISFLFFQMMAFLIAIFLQLIIHFSGEYLNFAVAFFWGF